VDIVFVIDGSTSVGVDDFKISISFIIDIIDSFPVTPWGVQIGFVVVQPADQIVVELGDYKEKAHVDAAIRQVVYPNGDNSVGAALTQAKKVLDGSKRAVPKLVVLLLDNKAADDVSNPAKELKNSGVGVVSIAGSGDVDQGQLNTISGTPEYVVTTTSYSKLPSIMGTVIEKINTSMLGEFLVLFYTHSISYNEYRTVWCCF
jgi:collagen type XII alpha